ncbi:hypothetical protein GYMLUDRAFT_76935 [Collybiopsis luxurians FD-317 M1]|uniref:Unplaced genomic scaffold GYMLUscaffold_66, whole genome shotgun sequence n=1 Tax=Collybiopsis luxurians FD-317 M1 TaxID=944289 RepID=A0A0D0C9F7_9AGAR|nr:hypothetical protein GYMLUDRAFT_76935 [Collybiopsis luxurians FD-317 M1]
MHSTPQISNAALPSSPSSPSIQMSTHPLDAFLTTHSRVVRFHNLPPNPQLFLTSFFLSDHSPIRPIPQSLWTMQDKLGIWAVFKSHEQACAILSLPITAMSIAPALESDLEPFSKLDRFHLSAAAAINPPPPHQTASFPPSHRSQMLAGPSQDTGSFPLSSNPPNPRSNFRLGDWICSSPKCAAHNFGRNIACIGCGCTRSANSPTSPTYPNRPPLSPRFAASPNASNFPSNVQVLPAAPPAPSPAQQQSLNLPSISQSKNGHPLLTPSGRAFAVGGRVQNISMDPLSPCIMYWPDNEPFPDPGQIRPNGLVAIPHPPILNTGNRGPIAHQPGDWICQKCNYLNWRRRKVCQTCFPCKSHSYAEGNGDSISAAVQAERIALLTSVLAHHPSPAQHPSLAPLRTQVLRAHSVTPPQVRRSFVDISPPQSRGPGNVVHRSQSQVELGSQYTYEKSLPIYQTSGHRRPSPVYSTRPSQPKPSLSQQQQQLQHHLQIQQLQQQLEQLQLHAPTPAPLLPSFLQDMVRSPTLSPSSTSSADLSFDEYEDMSVSPSRTSVTSRSRQTSSDSMKLVNIWKMDGEETKTMSAFALPNSIIGGGGSRKSSLEKLKP